MITMAVTMYRTMYLKTKYFRQFGHDLIYSVFVGGFLVWFPIFKKENNPFTDKLRQRINKHLTLFYGLFVILLICTALMIRREL